MDAEEALYKQTEALLTVLNKWIELDVRSFGRSRSRRARPVGPLQLQESSSTLEERVESLWVNLYERGFVEEQDVLNVQLWLETMASLGYDFSNEEGVKSGKQQIHSDGDLFTYVNSVLKGGPMGSGFKIRISDCTTREFH